MKRLFTVGAAFCGGSAVTVLALPHLIASGSYQLTGRPATPEELGRAGWTILHSTAAAFPEQPTEAWRHGAMQLLHGWATVYPCRPCALHMREYIVDNPPDLSSRVGFSKWLLDFHNAVNVIRRQPIAVGDPIEVYGYPGLDTDDDLEESPLPPLVPPSALRQATPPVVERPWSKVYLPSVDDWDEGITRPPRSTQIPAHTVVSGASVPSPGTAPPQAVEGAQRASIEDRMAAMLAKCAHWCPKERKGHASV